MVFHTGSKGKDIQNYYLNFKRLILMYSARDLEHILNELLLFPLPMSHHFFFFFSPALEHPKFLVQGLL